jgi:hypothetical protein
MAKPSYEPEVLRAKVSVIVEELRDMMRELGFDPDEVAGMTRQAERNALDFVGLEAGH